MSDPTHAAQHAVHRGGGVHRGLVALLRDEPGWLIERLAALGLLPGALRSCQIQVLPPEVWPVGEENRPREIRADVVMRLWPASAPSIPGSLPASPSLSLSSIPVGPSLALIRTSRVTGLIVDVQDHQDPEKLVRVVEYDSAYPPYLGPDIHLILLTLREPIARWFRAGLARKSLFMTAHVVWGRDLPRSGPIDARSHPRRALLEAMMHVEGANELPLLTDALRALRCFEGNELRIYREMLMAEMPLDLIQLASQDLDTHDDYPLTADYEPDERERRSFLYKRGEQAGHAEGRAEGRKQGHAAGSREGRRVGRVEGRAQALLDLLELRGVVVDPASAATILACRDTARLTRWLALALVAERVEALFETPT